MRRPYPIDRIDPATITQFSVIRLNFQFPSSNQINSKLFVVIGHYPADHLWCLKTTHNTQPYENIPARLRGVVKYESKSRPYFPVKTIVEVDNALEFRISYKDIRLCQRDGSFKLEGMMPLDFLSKLRRAVADSVTLDGERRKLIAEALRHAKPR